MPAVFGAGDLSCRFVSMGGARSAGSIGPGVGVSWVRPRPNRRSSTPDLLKLIAGRSAVSWPSEALPVGNPSRAARRYSRERAALSLQGRRLQTPVWL
jgi:hypothetical protein